MDLSNTNKPSRKRNFFDLFNVGETFPTPEGKNLTGKVLEFPSKKNDAIPITDERDKFVPESVMNKEED